VCKALWIQLSEYVLRRTKATLISKRTKNLRAVQLLLGHTKLESTVRHLGTADSHQAIPKSARAAFMPLKVHTSAVSYLCPMLPPIYSSTGKSLHTAR
jgi:integrase